jgi:hypothetical protein
MVINVFCRMNQNATLTDLSKNFVILTGQMFLLIPERELYSVQQPIKHF